MEKIIGLDLNEQYWLICQLPGKYGGFGLRSGKPIFGAQYVVSLQKCRTDMATHTEGWCLGKCAKDGAESWLKNSIGADFDIDNYLSEREHSPESPIGTKNYAMSLAQRCEHACYERLLKSLSENDRLRLISNSGPTQTWVTALPLSWKNWNLSLEKWFIAARRRLGLDVRMKRIRCSNCRFHQIDLKGDHALRCSGKMGLKMRHDALTSLLARALSQAGFRVKMEQSGGLLDQRRPGDVEVEDWVVINNWKKNKALSIDVAISDPTGDSHSEILRRDGVRAAASRYEDPKRKKYRDMKGHFSPFVLEAQGGFGMEAKSLVRELERRRKKRECVANMRHRKTFSP